jgi:ATP-binding protein involved in chromosome partitioning
MQPRSQRARIDSIERVLVVGSGKGGVGKSTVSVNLAVALAKRGASVGLLDGDAYGPSIPMMLGVRKRSDSKGATATLPLAERRNIPQHLKLKPLLRYGVKIMSVGFFIGEEQAVAPMPDALGLLIRQLLYSVNWGELDYLIIDLPPGTSEPQATLCSEVCIDGAVLVTTPQDIARIDTAKAFAMFQQVRVPVLGVVQNMDGFICPHCGERAEIFPHSSETRTLLDSTPLLGRIPLDPVAVTNGDRGYPVVISMPETPVALAFIDAAHEIVHALETREGIAKSEMPETDKNVVQGNANAQNGNDETTNDGVI